MNAIAHRLKNLRDGKNLTQGNVAEYLVYYIIDK